MDVTEKFQALRHLGRLLVLERLERFAGSDEAAVTRWPN